jgi:hypothetical protein
MMAVMAQVPLRHYNAQAPGARAPAARARGIQP